MTMHLPTAETDTADIAEYRIVHKAFKVLKLPWRAHFRILL